MLQHIAQKILFKCDGCLFAITIIGTILWENKAQTQEIWEDVYEQFKYYADKAQAAEDYKGESKTIFAGIKLSLEYGQEESDRVGMENILRTLTLFENVENIGMEGLGCPAIVVHLAWSYLQPQRGINHFKTLLNCLIARNLVENCPMSFNDSSMLLYGSYNFNCLRLPKLVKEYASMKLEAIDMCNVLEMKSQEFFMGRKKFLPIYRTRHTNLEFALSLGQFYYEGWSDEKLFLLLGTKAENAILLASQPDKVTQGDVDALLHLLNFDKYRAWPAAFILAQLADFHGDDILQHRSIQGFIQNLKQDWKTLIEDSNSKSLCHCPIALKLVKYRTFAEQFAIDEDFMEIFTNIIMQSRFGRSETFNLLFKLSQHKNIFYQTYTKISMKNILKQISSMLIQTIKSSGLKNVYDLLDFSLRYEDLAMQIIDKGGDDIVLGIFHHLFKLQKKFKRKSKGVMVTIEEVLFVILERLANRKEGEAIIIKHAHLLLRLFLINDETNRHYDLVVSKNITTLVLHKGIAQALITQEGVELFVGALEQGNVGVVPLVLQCLFFENEEFAYKVIARGGWRMLTKGLQLIGRGGRRLMTQGSQSIGRGGQRLMTPGRQSFGPRGRTLMTQGLQSFGRERRTVTLMTPNLQ